MFFIHESVKNVTLIMFFTRQTANSEIPGSFESKLYVLIMIKYLLKKLRIFGTITRTFDAEN